MASRITERRGLHAAAVVAVASLVLAACGDGETAGESEQPTQTTAESQSAAESQGITQEQFDEAMSTPTALTFWTWVNDIQNQVDLFEAQYPAMDVEVVNVGQGSAQYQKLRTAIQSGTGAPDVVQIEFQYIPTFTLGGDLLDLAAYGAGELSGDYAEWIWSQVSDGDAVYAIPQDTGPMGLLYREDILTEHGIEVPTTWEEFAQASVALHEADPDVYLTDLPGNDAGQVVGLLWQAGARPFGYDGGSTVTIDLTSPETVQVISYWNDLVATGSVATDPDFTDSWYQGLSSGKYASWLTAAWGPLFLQGTAGNTSGLWRATELPQWEEGQSTSGNWGGSTSAVLADTQNPIAAAELATFINTDHTAALMLANEQFLFPPSETILNDAEFTQVESEFYGGQRVNELFTEISGTVDSGFAWLPFMDFVYSSFNETLGAAIADRSDLLAGLEAWQARLVDYAEAQGFTVS